MSATTTSTRRVIEFDHHGLQASHDRASVLDLVRDEPVFYTESHGGYWVVTRYDLARQVLRDAETFSSQKHEDGSGGVTIPTAPGPRLIPAEADAPYHRALRKIVNPPFNPRAVEALRPMVEAMVKSTVDHCIEKGEFDVVHDIADVIPAGVIVSYLGFPEEERVPFIKSVQAALSVIPLAAEGEMTEEVQAGMEAFAHAVTTIQELVAERRAEPTDDLVSHILAPEHELTDDELLWLIFTLIVGGAENPAALISNALLYLHEDDALRNRLIGEPEAIPAAIEELLRFVTAGVSLARNITRDVELHGQQLSAGERILVWLPAINHDTNVFERPDVVDIDRPSCPHMAFGDGPHFCVGKGLARLEFELLFGEILTRMPDFRINTARAERFDDAATMYGWRTMPATTGL